ncbi:SDR family NAD(P)-dependent oxidoreductase [Actinosynnema sp. NPDC059797]
MGAPGPVAVVGMGLVLPGVSDPEQFWALLNQDTPVFGEPYAFDVDRIHDRDARAEDKTYARLGGYVGRFDAHPAVTGEHVRSPDQVPVWLRHSLAQALDGVVRGAGDRHGCYVGTWPGGSLAVEESLLVSAAARGIAAELADDPDERARHEARLRGVLRRRYRQATDTPGAVLAETVVRSAMAGLVEQDADWLTVDTACSSALYAVDLGVKSLLAGDCDIALCAGAVSTVRRDQVLFAKLNGLSRGDDPHVYDERADGVLFCEGASAVALKLLDRALADGDEVLGVIAGFGVSADGRGMAISAPNPVGQRLAVRRARAAGPVVPRRIDWVVGHGTGTPTGDLVELSTLAELAPEGGYLCTSNKSLIGHPGWVAGTTSLIHALLALKHERIPAQQRFATPPAEVPADRVRVPVTPVDWPTRPDRPRTAAVSAFGFGGTNAHLLLQDTRPGGTTLSGRPRQEDALVLVGTHVLLPGQPDPQQVRQWLRTGGGAPPRGFGPDYPLPPFTEIRMPPITARTVDRCQLMAVSLACRFAAEHGALWDGWRDTTGVIAAHMGPPTSMTGYELRVCADDLRAAVSGDDNDHAAADRAALETFVASVRDRVPASNDDSMPGLMPNIIASRVANRFDLHGLALTVDTGRTSTQTAIRVAAGYLHSGELDLALVVAVNGNSTPEMADLTGLPVEGIAEGGVLLALTRERFARERGWPVLAELRVDDRHTGEPVPEVVWGERADEPSYLAADGALAVLRALARDVPAARVRSTHPGPGIVVSAPAGPTPDFTRHVVVTRRTDPVATATTSSWLPPGGVVLTDSAVIAATVADRVRAAGAVLLCTDPDTPTGLAAVIADVSDDPAALAVLDGAAPHVRVIAAAPSRTWPAPPPPARLRLQDLALLALARFGDRLAGGSVAALVPDRLRHGRYHPDSALLCGFVRGVAWERTCPAVAVVTNADLDDGLAQLAAEAATRRERPVVFYRNGQRHIEVLCPAPLTPPRDDARPRLDRDSVIVATGGARGITAIALTALATRHRPRMWLLGSSPLEQVPAELRDAPDDAVNALRAAHITAGRRQDPRARVPELSARFDALWRSREAESTLRRLREICGQDRVHYLACDVSDPDQVVAAAAEIGAHTDRIDLLLHGAGRLRSADIATKTLSDFRAVRDPKVLGYANLKAAFTDPAPRAWCHFGSVVGAIGWAGETDYGGANEYLAAAARTAEPAGTAPEITLGWPMWADTGMGTRNRDLFLGQGMRGMSNAEGVTHLLAELSRTGPADPAPVYLGPAELKILDEAFPGHVSAPPDRHHPGLLDEPGADGRRTWRVRPDRDRYLLEHLVEGKPTIPATLLMTAAIEAARAVIPDRGAPSALEDLRFQAFCRLHPDRGDTLFTLTTEVVTPDRVRVRITSDVTAPNGHVLVRDRENTRIDVVFGPHEHPTPRPVRPDPDAAPIADPYYLTDSPIQLTGAFRTTGGTSVGRHLAHTRWTCHVTAGEPFAALPFPALLIDALLRMSSYDNVDTDAGRIGVVTCRHIDRIALHTDAGDAELSRRHPGGVDLYHELGGDSTAVDPDGVPLVHATGMDMPVIDTVALLPGSRG